MAAETQERYQLTGKTVILASAAGLVLGGPLLALMGFCFLATAGLFLIASPLLLLVSPLLLGAGFVFVTALTGFGVAAFMAIAGLSSLAWLFRSLFRSSGPRLVGLSYADKLGEKGGDIWAGYLQHNPQENMPNRG